jgi:hypothetical protein
MKNVLLLSLTLLVSCTPAGMITKPDTNSSSADVQSAGPARDRIETIAAGSQCASYSWQNRGRAPKAYMKGMALVFARSVCNRDRADVKIVSAARGMPGSKADRTDGLTWYDSKFRELGMPNNAAGLDTLRHAYVLLIGLGMRESSGRYCVGRDRSADFSSADSAEAGIFQTSWGVSRANSELPALFQQYRNNQNGCLLDVFRQNVSCSEWDARTWGEGTGAEWQRLTKSCPTFATEYGAVVLRTSGGSKGEYGPIRKRAAEILPECDKMLLAVQQIVQSDSKACSEL